MSRQTLCGMVLVAIGTLLFCTVGAMVQYHGGSVLQLMLGRYTVQSVISWFLWWCNPCRIRGDALRWFGDSPHRSNIWARGLFLFLTVLFWWRGLEMVPLGDGEAILFLSPMTTVIAARYFLDEALPSTFLLTTALNAAGLVFICRPTMVFGHNAQRPLSWEGVAFLFAAALVWSAAVILVRTAKDAHWLQLEITATTQSVLVWCPLLIAVNQYVLKSDVFGGVEWDLSIQSAAVMAAMGAVGFLALMCNVKGYQMGDATKVAWMEYLDLVFAFLFQWQCFGELPTKWDVLGCALLVSACLVNVAEEYLRLQRRRNGHGLGDPNGNGSGDLAGGKGMESGNGWNIVDLSNLQNADIDRERQPLLTSILYFDAKAMGFRMDTDYCGESSPDPD